MPQEILSIAIFETLEGMEEQAIADVHALMDLLESHQYCRDSLHRSDHPGTEFVLLRYWYSEAARREALENPEAQRLWAKLAHEIRMLKVYESLLAVPATPPLD